jgi:Exopolyphosphatase-related proteins
MAEQLVSSSRLGALRSALGNGAKPVLLVIHDYPDPDAIASALAIQTLAGAWGVSAIIVQGGGVGRAGNAEMIRLLKIDLRTFASIPDLGEYAGAVFLDTQPQARNQSLPDYVPVLAVIDHHDISSASTRLSRRSSETGKTVYSDVRSNVGASSTLAFGYLDAAGIVPDARLATALFLGIKTDTDSLLRNASPGDIGAYVALLPLADIQLAAQVIHPPQNREYYVFMHQAAERSTVYGSTLLANLGDISSQDMLSEASDYLINFKGMRYALAVGFKDARVFMSLRAKPSHADATAVLLHVLEPEGKGGGHGLSAGGFIDGFDDREAAIGLIRDRLLEATGDIGSVGEHLIPEELVR